MPIGIGVIHFDVFVGGGEAISGLPNLARVKAKLHSKLFFGKFDPPSGGFFSKSNSFSSDRFSTDLF